MQTKEQAMRKYRMMKKDLHKAIDKKVESLLNSGAISLEYYDNNFQLPKVLLCAALKEQVRQYTPFTEHDQREVKNLEHF